MIAALFAASFTFTAAATGVGKGTPLEFVFVGPGSDRDYEAMFVIEESIDSFCRRIEAAGLPLGTPTDAAKCRLWPVGCELSFSPAIEDYVKTTLPDGVKPAPPVYTGGTRDGKGVPAATDEMPASLFSLYTLAQSPVVFDGIYDQGRVYGAHLAAVELKKGTRVAFTVSWDPKALPRHVDIEVSATNAVETLAALRRESAAGEIDVTVRFSPSLSVAEAASASSALAHLDSPRIKLNGVADGNLFYRAFLPDTDWTNRTTRLVQPFELTLGESSEKLVFIDEDWTVEGDDPKLTLRTIPFGDASKHPKTDTCFVFASATTKLSRVFAAKDKLKGSNIRTWYVFTSPCP